MGLYSQEVPSMLLRLLVAMVLSSVFGWEREARHRAAGLRTHILVCMGATLITIVSESYARPGSEFVRIADPARLTAQIVSGIGFLGAGTILVRGSLVRGLTTAASLWVSAAIGIAVGRGGEFFVVAFVASLMVLFVLTVMDRLEDILLERRWWREVTVRYPVTEGSDAQIVAALEASGARVRRIERQGASSDGSRITVMEVKLPNDVTKSDLNDRLLSLDWLQSLEWDR